MKKALALLIGVLTLLLASTIQAQNDLAATLEVLAGGVTVQRINTSNPISVNVEAIVGVGDIIRTDATGRARITFFADGTDTELHPNTEYLIEEFTGNDNSFTLLATVLVGQTQQRLGRIIDANSSYTIRTPGMALAARGTTFAIRVEENGRSAMLVSSGLVGAESESTDAEIGADYGIRASDEEGLSDVVRAVTFAELDAALDGCPAVVSSFDDMRLNVRVGPSITYPRVGTIAPEEITLFMGTVPDGDWYRIAFRDNFGWILSTDADVLADCAGLRVFEINHVEDPSLYSFIGDSIEIDLNAPIVTPSPTVQPSSEGGNESETDASTPGVPSGDDDDDDDNDD
jgi:hypothetical protein